MRERGGRGGERDVLYDTVKERVVTDTCTDRQKLDSKEQRQHLSQG